MKKILTLILTLTLVISSFAGCANKEVGADKALQGIYDSIDVEYSAETATGIANCGTHEDLGYRLAGSDGEQMAADYLYSRFKETGLTNVTRHESTVDTWSMTKSDLTYKDENGEDSKIVLGGYQTTFESENQQYEMIYLDEGTADAYEGINAEGKVILIDIDQSENWWINWPAYQAKLKGAACVIAANSGSYGQLDGETLLSQDICGPANAPALSITNKDADILKTLIKNSSTKSINVNIDCDAKVTNDGKSQNISGMIPGKTDEIIFLMGHYDGYYHAWHDDASGVGMALSIAKAIIDSGYKPEKTIIVVTHGSEEWGVENSRYDWAKGAYEQITNITPEWADNGFAVINCESGCARDDDTHLCLGASFELQSAIKDIVDPMNEQSPWKENSEIYSPATVWSEDFSYSLAGIPGMVTKKTSGNFNENSYHTNKDTKEDHYSAENYEFSHKVFCNILYSLDNMPIEPLNFETRLKALSESITANCPDKATLLESTKTTLESAASVNDKIKELNSNDTSLDDAKAMNKKLRETFKFAQNNLTAFDWEDNVVFPHDCIQSNIENLDASIKALEKGDIKTVVDEYLSSIDSNWYAYDFDKETYNFFVDQTLKAEPDKLIWGKGMIRQGNEDLFDVVKSLNSKYDEKNADVATEIAVLNTALNHQKEIGTKIVAQEIKDINTLNNMLQEMLK